MTAAFRKATHADAPEVAKPLFVFTEGFSAVRASVHSDDDVGMWIVTVLIPSDGVTVAISRGAHRHDGAVPRQGGRTEWIDQLFCTHRSSVAESAANC